MKKIAEILNEEYFDDMWFTLEEKVGEDIVQGLLVLPNTDKVKAVLGKYGCDILNDSHKWLIALPVDDTNDQVSMTDELEGMDSYPITCHNYKLSDFGL